MAESETESRRRFLKSLALLLGCQQLGAEVFAAPVKSKAVKTAANLAKPASKAADAAKYKLAPWCAGDDFTLGHKLRMGEWPTLPEKAERKVDFVIVGGGVAGLTAAYNLKDQDFLLLEQYDSFGGHARGGSYHGIDYSYGAAYIGSTEGEMGEFYSALGLEPVELPPERNDYYFEGKWYNGVAGDVNKPVYKEFKRLLDESKPIWKGLPEDPDPLKMSSGDLQKLDASPFASTLTGYSKEFMSLLDAFCKSSFGGNLQQLSALAGYSLIQDLVIPTHVFKGGNPALGRGLAAKVNTAGTDRCVKNAFVWKIEIKDGGASVVYTTRDGSSHKVDCKHVIVATPPLVATRQMVHIPDLLKAQLLQFKFCSYLVANLLMKEKLFKGAYDCFLPAPFTFADITVAETPYIKTNTYKPEMGSVLTVYQPYPNGAEGRTLMLIGDRQKFADSITQQADKLIPGFFNAIDEVQLTRWGHALAIVGPSYFAKLAKLQASQSGDAYSLAHSSIFGWPAAESAIRAGQTAAARAKKVAANPGIIVN